MGERGQGRLDEGLMAGPVLWGGAADAVQQLAAVMAAIPTSSSGPGCSSRRGLTSAIALAGGTRRMEPRRGAQRALDMGSNLPVEAAVRRRADPAVDGQRRANPTPADAGSADER